MVKGPRVYYYYYYFPTYLLCTYLLAPMHRISSAFSAADAALRCGLVDWPCIAM